VSIGLIKGFSLGNGALQIKQDVTKIFIFVFFLGLPIYIVFQKRNFLLNFSKYFNFFSIIYTILVSLSLIIVGSVNEENHSIYPGNLFGASTVNLTIISAWAFYGIAIFNLTGKKLFLYWSALCYVDCLISLAKWNTIAIICYPILLGLTISANFNITKGQKKQLFAGFLLLIVLLFTQINLILTPFVKSAGWANFDEFLNNRVFGDSENTANLSQTVNVGDAGLKDGARLAMWTDLVNRTLENPLIGIGFGGRALDYEGLDVEDHNIFVTHFSRYGILLFLGWLWATFKIIKWLSLKVNHHRKSKIINYAFYIIYLNFFFQASVGNVWGQILVALFIGISIGLMIFLNDEFLIKS
jgi:hypothetical protein